MPDTLTGYRVYTNLKIPAYAWKVRISLISLPLDNQQDISDLFLSFFTLLNFHRGDFPLSSLEEEKVQEKKYYRLPYEGEKTVHLPLPPPPPPLPFYQVSLAIHPYHLYFWKERGRRVAIQDLYPCQLMAIPISWSKRSEGILLEKFYPLESNQSW